MYIRVLTLHDSSIKECVSIINVIKQTHVNPKLKNCLTSLQIIVLASEQHILDLFSGIYISLLKDFRYFQNEGEYVK